MEKISEIEAKPRLPRRSDVRTTVIETGRGLSMRLLERQTKTPVWHVLKGAIASHDAHISGPVSA